MFKITNLTVGLAILSAQIWVQSAVAAEPLLDQMAGTWVGEGERVQSTSGHRIQIQTHTVASWAGEKLFSHNEITETDADLSVKVYTRDYWIRANPAQAGHYDLGVEENITSRGQYDDGVLEVEQKLGGVPAYVIHSRTQFDAQGSLYEETVWYGNRQLSQTRIRYHR